MSSAPTSDTSNRKLTQLLETATEVFMRYGFRKTSMNDVAAAADISRQGLYLHFTSKEALFKAAVTHMLADMKAKTNEVLADKKLPLEERLFRAFDETMGRHVGKFTVDSVDLIEAGQKLLDGLFDKGHTELTSLIASTIDEAMLADKSLIEGITNQDRAEALLAIAGGHKHCCETREEFRKEMRKAIRVVLAPLKLRK